MLKQFGEWLVAKQLHASIVVFACIMATLIHFPGTMIASIILAFVTLRNGARFGAIVLVWVALPAIALALRSHFSYFDLIWIRCSIIYLLALTLRHTHRWNDILALLTVIGVAVIAAVHFWIPNIDAKWLELANQFMTSWVQSGQQKPEHWAEMATMFSHIGTGILVMMFIAIIFVQLMVARVWQAMIYNPGAFKLEILSIKINKWVSLILPLFIVLMFVFPNGLMTDALPVMLFPFAIAGLVVLHLIAVTSPSFRFAVVIAYIATLIVSYLVCLWALLGFVDAWVTLPARNRAFEIMKKGEK